MKPSRIFIASSSEGLPVTEALQAQLQQRLGGDTELRPWTREFDLSATYIESLSAPPSGPTSRCWWSHPTT